MATFQIQTVILTESATGRGLDFKMETLLIINCVD
jgi:hypothetical protein